MKIVNLDNSDVRKNVTLMMRVETIDALKQAARDLSVERQSDVSYSDLIRELVESGLARIRKAAE